MKKYDLKCFWCLRAINWYDESSKIEYVILCRNTMKTIVDSFLKKSHKILKIEKILNKRITLIGDKNSVVKYREYFILKDIDINIPKLEDIMFINDEKYNYLCLEKINENLYEEIFKMIKKIIKSVESPLLLVYDNDGIIIDLNEKILKINI